MQVVKKTIMNAPSKGILFIWVVSFSACIEGWAEKPSPSPNSPAVSEALKATASANEDGAVPAAPVQTKSIKRFFEIQNIRLLEKEPKDEFGVWSFQPNPTKQYFYPDKFQTCLEVTLSVTADIRSDRLVAKAYFFGPDNALLTQLPVPSKAGAKAELNHFPFPIILSSSLSNRIFFEIPAELRGRKWRCVVVFGDGFEMSSLTFPAGNSDFTLEYPEKKLRSNRVSQEFLKSVLVNPLIEHVVKTKSQEQPQITLFVRLPKGVEKASDAKGVLALCVLAPSVDSLKRELQKEEMAGDYRGFLAFATQHKLAVVAWGSRQLWDPTRSYNELSPAEARASDREFDFVAESWAKGIDELSAKVGLPRENYILWGLSGAGQWAMRLCLRKPQYFLAINIHCASSYDQPTSAAKDVLWCVTTGELESGYERATRFFKECRNLGYPIIYKAIPGLGHRADPQSFAIGFDFMDFALTQRGKKPPSIANAISLPASKIVPSVEDAKPWPDCFSSPPFFGDYLNQDVFPSGQVEMIPAALRVALPTKELAKAWLGQR